MEDTVTISNKYYHYLVGFKASIEGNKIICTYSNDYGFFNSRLRPHKHTYEYMSSDEVIKELKKANTDSIDTVHKVEQIIIDDLKRKHIKEIEKLKIEIDVLNAQVKHNEVLINDWVFIEPESETKPKKRFWIF